MPDAQGSRLLERRYDDVRLAVALAARDLFLECQSTAVTVEAIAQRAEVSERTFYRHFASKADLVSPLFKQANRALMSTLRTADPSRGNLVDALVEIFTRQVANDRTRHAELFELLMETPEYRLRWESIDVDLVDAITECLANWSVHPGDDFIRRVTALTIMTASRASYVEWMDGGRTGGIGGLRALHTQAFTTLARTWLPAWREHAATSRTPVEPKGAHAVELTFPTNAND